MDNVSKYHSSGGNITDSMGDPHSCESLLYDSDDSDEDILIDFTHETQHLLPSSYFTNEDVQCIFSNPTSSYSSHPNINPEITETIITKPDEIIKEEEKKEEKPKEIKLEGPGVLRGVRIPSPKKKEKRGKYDRQRKLQQGKGNNKKMEDVGGNRKGQKSLSNRFRETHSTRIGKALTADDLKDDKDYQR